MSGTDDRAALHPLSLPLLATVLGMTLAWACYPPRAMAAWEGSFSWSVAWEIDRGPVHLLQGAATGPAGVRGWQLEVDGVLQTAGGPDEEGALVRLQEGRLALVGPPARLQLLLDRPHLPTGDPLALIAGSRRGERQPAVTLEAAGRSWDLAAQLVRRIDNPGPDGDLASARVQRWWPHGRAALTLFRLERGMLPAPEGAEAPERALLQQMAALEGYFRVGEVEVGMEVARAATADLKASALGSLAGSGAGLVRLRTQPWRPSVPFRLEAGLFQTDAGFRSLATRERPLPDGVAGAWLEARWTASGGRRFDAAFLHGRGNDGRVAAEATLQGRLTHAGFTWTAGVEGKKGAEEPGTSARARLGLRRSGLWEAQLSGGGGSARATLELLLVPGVRARLGWDAADGGTSRVEVRQVTDGSSWRLVWKSRARREPDRHLFLEAERSLAGGWFGGARVGRWDRGRFDALWGLPRRLEVTLGLRF